MSNIPPSSASDYQDRVTAYSKTQQAYQKGMERATGIRQGEVAPVTIGHLPKQAAVAVANRIEQPPVLEAPAVAVPMAEQMRGLKRLADTAHNTPRLNFTPFQANALLKVDSKLDPTLSAMYLGLLQEKAKPQEVAQALEDGLIQYMNPDGTPKRELKEALNGKGIGQYVTRENVPESAQAALKGGSAMQAQGGMQSGPVPAGRLVRHDATIQVEGSLDTTQTKDSGDATKTPPDPNQSLNDYLTACLEKGWGAGKGLSPLFALMLLITQYSNMRSLMDEKLGMIRQQAIKAGYDAQIADMTSKAYAALGMAILTGVATAASAAIQIKGYVKKPDAAMQKEVKDLQGQKAETDKGIASEKAAISKNKNMIEKLEAIKRDPVEGKRVLNDRLQKLEELNQLEEIRKDPNRDAIYRSKDTIDWEAHPENFKEAPSTICDENGRIDYNALKSRINALKTDPDIKKQFPDMNDAGANVDKDKLDLAINSVQKDQNLISVEGKLTDEKSLTTKIEELKAANFQSQERLTTLERGSDIQGQNIDAKQNAIISKQTTQVQTVNTILQGFIQFVGSISQFTSALFDIQIKGHEYQVTEDTFFQRQLGVNQQQAEQSISSVRQAYAQAEESTSGTLGGIARNIV